MLRIVATDGQGRLYACEGRSMYHVYPDERDGFYIGTRAPDGTVDWVRLGALNGFPELYSAFSVAVSRDGMVQYVYIGTGDWISGGDDLLYKSTDGGRTFTQIVNIATQFDDNVRGLFVNPDEPNKLYVVTGSTVLDYTPDGGATWQVLREWPTTDTTIESITMDLRDPSVLYACGFSFPHLDPVQQAQVFKSTDGGATWQDSTMPQRPSKAVSIAASGSEVLMAAGSGAYRSRDGGVTWNLQTSSAPANAFGVRIDIADSSVAYGVSTGSGQYKSLDWGADWFSINVGDYSKYGLSSAQESAPPYRLYVGDLYGSGVFSYIPGYWTRCADACLLVSPPTAFACRGRGGNQSPEPREKTYKLSNAGATDLAWSASATRTWIVVTPASGTIAAGESATVRVQMHSATRKFAPGIHTGTVNFTNVTNGRGDTTRSVVVNSPDACLDVSPTTSLVCGGSTGGNLYKTYTLVNVGMASLNWTASTTQDWISVTPSSGTIAAGGSTTLSVRVDANAATLAPGTFTGAVIFANSTNGCGSTIRSVAFTKPETLYVSATAPGPLHNGKSWQTAFLTIQNAVVNALVGQEIRVAGGSYQGDFGIRYGCLVKGGYAGQGDARDVRAHVATIHGSVRMDNDSVIDGFSILPPAGPAAAIDCTNVTFAAIANNTLAGSPIGILCENGSSPSISNNAFSGHSSSAIYCADHSSPSVIGNTISNCGYGIHCYDKSYPNITNNVITHCDSGIYCATGGSPTITNNTIVACSDYCLCSTRYSNPVARNNIMAFSATGVKAESDSLPVLGSNDVFGNGTNYSGCGPEHGDISADPLFVAGGSGDYHFSAGSPCIDAGTSLGAPSVDKDGLIRPQDGNCDLLAVCDIGAYEYPLNLGLAKKNYADGSPVAFGGVSVIATFNSQGSIYVEKPDRTVGLRVDTPKTFSEAQIVSISGAIRTDAASGERFVAASDPWPRTMSGTSMPGSLLLTNRDLGGGQFGLQNPVWSWGWVRLSGGGPPELKWLRAAGLSNIGLLVKVCGRVTQIDPSQQYFYIDDGSGLKDDTQTNGEPNVGVRIAWDGRGFASGQHLVVTGVSSCSKDDDECPRRLLKARSTSDIHLVE